MSVYERSTDSLFTSSPSSVPSSNQSSADSSSFSAASSTLRATIVVSDSSIVSGVTNVARACTTCM